MGVSKNNHKNSYAKNTKSVFSDITIPANAFPIQR